ncbi:rRNA maturation RNase YbeY [Blautia wexlerae]|uniref:Endoribonuclease YbeY n=1 Tax=Blautia wexlerae TaxID=418240 RepID=A0ABX2GLV9_9FIRM|nr:rRNA maturation RNase YbeY [Blautia wexlerae]NSF73153.1 rRNA maturation RNase YbeY [Blautia wexlerae]
MTLQIDYETDREIGIEYEELAKKVVQKVLDMEGCPYDAQVNLVLTDNEEIQRVNTEFREIAAPTDVLSFPMIPFETPADYAIVEEDESYFDLDTDELLLGDIMISVDKVFAQAEEYGHSVTREFCFLVAHSMLHLLGYDHMTPEEAVVMENKQRTALDELGITR